MGSSKKAVESPIPGRETRGSGVAGGIAGGLPAEERARGLR
ncbi:unnamed protein product [Urochloa humidicola]